MIGALGASYTYQSLPFFDESFWALLRNHRVLVVFDEIHHCAGLNIVEANAWGKAIIEHIQAHARYTLSLTGTPWRSDKAPISLSSYNNVSTEIECDYVYGLNQAIKDGVCRLWWITTRSLQPVANPKRAISHRLVSTSMNLLLVIKASSPTILA
ncbi:DEAD/DEAH box helicase [Vibrio anguillarum]|uniref:DEAD/DEAH box helicase n=1 Tax=Vibrio anguillarum TaxID=55601 RepID=UPI001E333CA4|nr:hypothetical protein [Vibrio anguillarum]